MTKQHSGSSGGSKEPETTAPEDVGDSGPLPRDGRGTAEVRRTAAPRSATAPRMLIVDDDERACRTLQRVFRDYEVTAHTSGRDVVDRIANGERFDVILSDVAMPLMTGWELYDEIEQLDVAQAKRVIFITGGAKDTRTEWFLATCGQPVVGKPFTAADLREFVRGFLVERQIPAGLV